MRGQLLPLDGSRSRLTLSENETAQVQVLVRCVRSLRWAPPSDSVPLLIGRRPPADA